VTDALLEQLVAVLADSLAPRLADELAPRIAAHLVTREAQAEVKPWCLLTLDEAAARLGRSPRWLRARKEQIGYVRLDGGALAFRLEDLQAFATERIVGGPGVYEWAA
jgi:hypothetical protein